MATTFPEIERFRQARDTWAASFVPGEDRIGAARARVQRLAAAQVAANSPEQAKALSFRLAEEQRAANALQEQRGRFRRQMSRWKELGGQYVVGAKRDKTRKIVGQGRLSIKGIDQWVVAQGSAFVDRAMRVAAAASEPVSKSIFESWPTWSGFSKSVLDVYWGTNRADQLALVFASPAPYTLAAKPTRAAFYDARRRWRAMAVNVITSLSTGGTNG